MTTKVKTTEETRDSEKTRRSHEPPWNVVLHNDRNPIDRVVWRLWRTISGMSMKKATSVTWEAHTKGRAVAKTCHKELAELYEERLREKGLTVSVESGR
jgi:ATP-dependent Clp protease adaptor protein ClpS